MNTHVNLWQYLADFFLEWEMSQTEVVEKIRTHILCPLNFVEECGRGRQVTDDIIWHAKDAISMLDNWGKYTDTCL